MKLTDYLWELLFPRKCILCRRLLEREELDLCRNCRSQVEAYAPKGKYPYLDSLSAIWYYEKDVRRSILGYKFEGRRYYAESYARLLAMAISRQEVEFDVLTWIPISKKRLRKRGFDQVELLARCLGKELQLQPVKLLEKIHDNPPQSHISGRAERRANVLGVYRALDPQAISGKRILLLDDIITTGATAGECARVLLTAGAKEVHGAVLAAAREHK